MSNLSTVPFNNQNLIIIEKNGEPFTAMKPIVEGMGLDWSYQYRKINTNTKRWGVAVIATPSKGGEQSTVCLPLRKLFGWMMSVQPSRVKKELRATIEKYQDECDNALWDYWNEGHAVNPRATITPKQKLAIRDAMNKKVYDNYGKKQISSGFKAEWHEFYEAFEISKYEELPASRYDDAMGFLLGEWIPEVEQAALADGMIAVCENNIYAIQQATNIVHTHHQECMPKLVAHMDILQASMETMRSELDAYRYKTNDAVREARLIAGLL